MKKLFQNYNYEFNKNEKKLLSSFCRQSIKQMDGNNQFYAESRAFNSILDKLSSADESIKFTKDEKTKLTFQLKQNIKFIQKEMTKSWFLKKWMMRSLLKQYDSLIETHFRG